MLCINGGFLLIVCEYFFVFSDILSEEERKFASLGDICARVVCRAAIVKRSERIKIDINTQILRLVGLKFLCFRKTDKAKLWIAEPAARFLHINLRNFSACAFARVFNGKFNIKTVFVGSGLVMCDFKIGITQAKAERIKNCIGVECFKISITDKNILFIIVKGFSAEINGGRVVGIILNDCVGQPAARGCCAAKQIRSCVAAFHTALPNIHYCADFVAVMRNPAHINNVADIQKDNNLVKMRANLVKHCDFVVSQKITAVFVFAISVLARRPADCNNGGVTAACGGNNGCVAERHFVIMKRPLAPKAVVYRIFI